MTRTRVRITADAAALDLHGRKQMVESGFRKVHQSLKAQKEEVLRRDAHEPQAQVWKQRKDFSGEEDHPVCFKYAKEHTGLSVPQTLQVFFWVTRVLVGYSTRPTAAPLLRQIKRSQNSKKDSNTIAIITVAEEITKRKGQSRVLTKKVTISTKRGTRKQVH